MGDVRDINEGKGGKDSKDEKAGKGSRRRPSQPRLPHTQGPRRNDEIEKAAKKYVDVRDERMELTEREVKLRGDLIEKMKKHKLESYRCEDQNFVVNLSTEEKVKVTKVSDPTAESEEDGDE